MAVKISEQDRKARGNWVAVNFANIMALFMLVAIIVVMVYLTAVTVTVAVIDHLPDSGHAAYKLAGQSMQPTHYEGGIVITDNNVKISDLDVGDIICFNSGERNTCHRVHAFMDNGQAVETKGDHNDIVDEHWTYQNHLIGKVLFYVPGASWLLDIETWRTATATVILSLLAMLLIRLRQETKRMVAEAKPAWETYQIHKRLGREVRRRMANKKSVEYGNATV